MSKKILIIQTGSIADRVSLTEPDVFDLGQAFVVAGDFAPEATDLVKVFEDEALPDHADIAGVVISGSPHMVTSQLPWMEQTAQWLREGYIRGMPMLGVCFGHQLLAHAMGGVVGVNPQGPELTSVTIELNDTAQLDLLLQDLPKEFPMQAHHYESVLTLPAEAVVLAKSERDSYHAVRYGQHAWGVQFHPEISAAMMRFLLLEEQDKLRKKGLDPDQLLASVTETPLGPQLLRRFRDYVLTTADQTT